MRANSSTDRSGIASEIPAHVVMVEEIAAEFLVAILLDGLADALHQPEQVAQVVDRRQPSAGDLARLDEMADVRAGEIPAGVAVAALFNRAEIVGVLRVADNQTPLIGKAGAVARNAGGEHAVKHINAAIHALHEAIRAAHAHQIARLVHRHIGHHRVEHAIHDGLRLADGKAADAVAGEIHIAERLRALDAQILVKRALHNAEHGLILARVIFLAALRPAVRAEHGLLRGLVVAGIRRAHVKRHGDVAAQRLLNGHAGLRTDEHLAAVEVAAEMHALFLDLAQAGEREDLESAGIGEDRLIPAHKFVQPARLLDQFLAGADVQVIGVGEDDLRADLVQFARGRPLDGRLRAHRHKDRGLDVAVRGMHNAAPRMGFRVLFDKVKRSG